MATTKFHKNGKVSINGLTQLEYDILWECLSRCKDCMEWEDEFDAAYDGERFLWQIENREEFETLKKLEI